MTKISVVEHPLIQHKLSLLREKQTSCAHFRLLLKEISMLLVYEVTRDLPLISREIQTPLEKMMAPSLESEHVILVSILRAGSGLLDGALELIPSAKVGFLGLYRDEKTLKPVEYYCKLPAVMSNSEVIVLDPMLATGHSMIAAVDKIKKTQPKKIKVVNLLAAPEGIEVFSKAHPDVDVFVAAIDRELNKSGYILPGLGDAGDRLFGTK
jgi:uracil phosphoribosyltransferase